MWGTLAGIVQGVTYGGQKADRHGFSKRMKQNCTFVSIYLFCSLTSLSETWLQFSLPQLLQKNLSVSMSYILFSSLFSVTQLCMIWLCGWTKLGEYTVDVKENFELLASISPLRCKWQELASGVCALSSIKSSYPDMVFPGYRKTDK